MIVINRIIHTNNIIIYIEFTIYSNTLICRLNWFRKLFCNPKHSCIKKQIFILEIMEIQMIRCKTQKYSYKND